MVGRDRGKGTQPFTRKSQRKGTGLGLAIAREMVERMGAK